MFGFHGQGGALQQERIAMSIRRFHAAKLIGNVVQLEFDHDQKYPLSLTIPIENANQLTAGLLNALRGAEQRGQQIPALEMGDESMFSINDLPVDQCQVMESADAPGRAFLHLVSGGLSLTYSFPRNQTKDIGTALAATAEQTQNVPRR
jgi:hypothetical protein